MAFLLGLEEAGNGKLSPLLFSGVSTAEIIHPNEKDMEDPYLL